MRKLNFFKTLLVAVGLSAGVNAWGGDVSTIYERGVSTNWSSNDYTTSALTADKWYSTGTGNTGVSIATVDDVNYLHVSARGKTTTGTATLTLTRTANTIVTIDAVMNTGSSTYASNDNRITFKYGAFTLNYYTRNSNAEYYINSTKTSLSTLANNIDLTIHLVVNSVDGSISALKVTRGDTNADIIDISESDTKTFDAGTDYETAVFQAYCNVSSNNTSANMKSFVVKEETQEVATADYTVKWAYANGTEIKQEVRNGAVGSVIGLTSSDMDSFFNEGETVRYLCISNDLDETTIGADGNTVVTITVRDAEKWSWTATAKYGETTLNYNTSGEVWEDENTIKIPYPRFLAVGSQLVGKAAVSNDLRQSETVTADNYTVDLEYTAVEGVDNLYLLSEAEELGTGIATSGTNYTTRVSNGTIIYASSGTLLSLPAGKYIFTLGAIGGDNNTHQTSYVVSAGSETIAQGTSTGNFLSLFTGSEFTLTGTTPVTFTCSDAASNRGIDLIYIQKTGDVELPATVSKAVTAAGYATYCSAYDLDLSSITAYTATIDGSNVTFNRNTSKVVAGTGLLIKAAEGTVNIPIVNTGASAVENNALIGVLENTDVPAGSFVLRNESNGVGFYQTASTFTVGANTAYIAALTGESSRSFIGFDFENEVSGISAVKTVKNTEAIYNLNGQRVKNATKGLFIKNGKKFVNK